MPYLTPRTRTVKDPTKPCRRGTERLGVAPFHCVAKCTEGKVRSAFAPFHCYQKTVIQTSKKDGVVVKKEVPNPRLKKPSRTQFNRNTGRCPYGSGLVYSQYTGRCVTEKTLKRHIAHPEKATKSGLPYKTRGPKPCKEGKLRNPFTGKCVNEYKTITNYVNANGKKTTKRAGGQKRVRRVSNPALGEAKRRKGNSIYSTTDLIQAMPTPALVALANGQTTVTSIVANTKPCTNSKGQQGLMYKKKGGTWGKGCFTSKPKWAL